MDDPAPAIDLGIEGIGPALHIGRGGFADVYRAEQLSLRRAVAVKVLRDPVTAPEAEARFRRECHAIGAVSDHPHIVGVHEGGFTRDGRAYLVMEFLPGGSLADRLKREGRLPTAEAVGIAVKIARALAVAHRGGVLHRDVKPANIMISAYGEPALADFGIARVEGGHQTATGLITASIAHAAPEALEGRHPTAATDIYSLGSTLHALVTGLSPHYDALDESVWPLMRRVISDPIPDLRERGMSPGLARVLGRALAKEPAERYQDADDLADDLAALLDDPAALTPVVADTTVGTEQTHRWSDTAAAVSPTLPVDPTMATGPPAPAPAATPGSTPPLAAEPPRRAGGTLAVVAGSVVAIAAVAGATWGLLLPALEDRSGSGGEEPQGSAVSIEGASVGPLEAGRSYPVELAGDGGAGDRVYRLVIDGVRSTPAEDRVPDLVAPVGRHRLLVEVLTDGRVELSAPLDFIAIEADPEPGFRAVLARVPSEEARWSAVIESVDGLGRAGHDDLEVLDSGDLPDRSPGVWLVGVPGFADGVAAEAYCARFDLGVPERCHASPIGLAGR